MTEQKITVRAPQLLSFWNLLTLIFITLKLTGHITWSWLWVLAPLAVPWIIFFSVLAVMFIIYIIAKN